MSTVLYAQAKLSGTKLGYVRREIQMYPPNLKLPHGGRRVCTISINKVNPSCMYYLSHLVGGLGV